MAKRQTNTSAGLELRTLSGTYESARRVIRVLDIRTISTYEQLKKRLATVARNADQIKELFTALEHLNENSETLGTTTLVAPAQHPLVTRIPFVPKDKEK